MLKKIATVAFALSTGLGWQWTNYLSRQKLLTDDQQFWIAWTLTLVFFLQQIYLVLPEPVPMAKARQRAKVIEDYLRGLLADYEQFIKSHLKLAPNDPVPVIRINVMLLARRFRIFKRLRIVYACCPNGVSYSSEELNLRWRKNQGITGAAWATGHDVIYDSKEPNLKGAAEKQTTKQKRITNGLNSVYAIPISNANSILGTLNLDSPLNIDKTSFNHGYVKALASNYASALVPHGFEDGVEA